MLWQPGYLPAMTLAGKTFIGSTMSAGVVIPAHDATAQVFGLWNPEGSGVNAVLVKLNLGVTTAATPAVSSLSLSVLPYTGGAVSASGSPISAFTQTVATPGRVGELGRSGARFTLSATMTAPTFFYSLSFSQESTSLANGLVSLTHDFSGCVVVTPGTYVGLGGSASPLQTFQASLIWFEIGA